MGARQDELVNRFDQMFDKSDIQRLVRKLNEVYQMKYYA
jgi:hypothetical protein